MLPSGLALQISRQMTCEVVCRMISECLLRGVTNRSQKNATSVMLRKRLLPFRYVESSLARKRDRPAGYGLADFILRKAALGADQDCGWSNDFGLNSEICDAISCIRMRNADQRIDRGRLYFRKCGLNRLEWANSIKNGRRHCLQAAIMLLWILSSRVFLGRCYRTEVLRNTSRSTPISVSFSTIIFRRSLWVVRRSQ